MNRRQLLLSTAVVVALLVPATPAATASPGVGGHSVGKQTLLLRHRTDRTHTGPARTTAGTSGSLRRLAVERDTGRVVIAIKVRPGSKGAGAAFAAVAGSARAQGGVQRRTLRQLNTVTVEMPESAAQLFSARMRRRADVAKVEVVPRRSLSFVPDDQLYPATSPYLNAVTAPDAWDRHRGDAGLRIAVVDSGVDVDHPDLVGRVAGTYNALTGGTDVTDTVGHGTFVAGVAAATGNNGVGIAGASLGASILAVKVDDAGNIFTDAVAAGIIWAADHDAKVINLSLGGNTPSSLESDAVAYAVTKGALVVAAAGNEANTTPEYPAAYPQVVAVGATDVATGGRASFSSFGPWVTVAAPGVNITGTAPTAGSDFWAPSYDAGSGTSFSSPIVAAEAALLWSLRPAASAADVRLAIIKSSHGYANMGLGAGQVDFLAAFGALRPDSAPTLSEPADGTTVAGVVPLSATSSAPKVRFLINGAVIGTPVVTSAGVATSAWPSWGQANGPVTVAAVDCSIDDLCNDAQPSQAGVTLDNVAPAVTSPTPSQNLTGTATLAATAPGGGVAFVIDGVRRAFDPTAPYSVTYPISSLVDGTHTIQALSCSTNGTTCAGPVSPPVSFTAKSLHPRIVSVSPYAFSPNGDGRYDTTKATYYLPDTEYVRFQVRNAAGAIVRTGRIGTLTAGTRALTWNGLLGSGARAANGAYNIEFVTSRATATGVLLGSASARVRVDTTAPTMSSITGNGRAFYPYRDTYKDYFVPTFSLVERATITMTVRTRGGALVRSFAGLRAVGASSMAWNGRNNAGVIVGAGTYYWTLTAQDSVGNRRTSSRYSVVVSSKRLVTRSATLSLRGSQYSSAGGSAACAWASNADSDFRPYGVWLANVCDPNSGLEIAGSTYRFTLPAAYSYSSLRVATFGNSLGTSTLGAAFTRWATGDFTFAREIAVNINAWRAFGSVAPSGLVNRSRLVETTLYVPNDYVVNDFDVSYVRLVVTYKVLA